MSKIFKNMIPYWKIVIAIIGLLVVQAWCDLSLPSYTSDIIDVGIQNHGVEHVMPEKIQEEEFQTAQFIMTDQEKRIWNDIYVKKGDTKVLKNLSQDRLEELDEQLALPLIMNYQMSAMEEKTFEKMVASQMASGSKNNGSQSDAASQGGKDAGSQNGNSAKVGRSSKNQSGLSVDQIEKFMGVKLHRFRQKKEDSDGNSKMVQCVDVRPVFIAMQKNGMLDEKTLFSTRDSMKNTIDTMGSSLVKTTGIAYAIACDKAAGVDVDKYKNILSICRPENGWNGIADGSCYRTSWFLCLQSSCRNWYDAARKRVQKSRWIFQCRNGSFLNGFPYYEKYE